MSVNDALAFRRRTAPVSLKIPGRAGRSQSVTPTSQVSPASLPTYINNMYGLDPSLFALPEPLLSPEGIVHDLTDAERQERDRAEGNVEQHERGSPRILIGREETWARYYEVIISADKGKRSIIQNPLNLWAVHLLENLEQAYPLQAVPKLTPRNYILIGWEGRIGPFTIATPALEKTWLMLPASAKTWWIEDYAAQLARKFPQEDIVFLLHRAEDVVSSLRVSFDECRSLKDSLFWLQADRTHSHVSSPLSSPRPTRPPSRQSHARSPPRSPPRVNSPAMSPSMGSTSLPPATRGRPSLDQYQRNVLHGHLTKIAGIRTALSAAHRLAPLLVVIQSLLGYLRARARHECAAIAARENAGVDTEADAVLIATITEIRQWHIEPEVRLQQLEEMVDDLYTQSEACFRDLRMLGEAMDRSLRNVASS